MNNFFYKLRTFFNRLHVILVTLWVAWEVIGKQSGADTPSTIISDIFSITYGGSIWSMIILFVISFVLWNYLISSFVDDEIILLDKLKLKNNNELIANHNEQFKQEENATSHLYAIMVVIILIIVLVITS